MTELATLPHAGGLAGLPQTADVIQLHEWAAELTAAHQLGNALARSSFLPMSLRLKGKNNYKTIEELTNDAAAVILAGKSVGLDPMQSVQNIFSVHGMPSMYARTMVALVLAQGHEVERGAATDQSVSYRARRKGSDHWQEFIWTLERAKKAGYTKNDKYQSDPIAMLGAKAAAEACRTVFPDVLLGMAYSVEDMELEDLGEVEAAAPAPAAAPAVEKPKRVVKRRQAPAPAVPDVVTEPPAPEPEPEPETDAGDDVVNQETGELPPERDWLAEIDLANGDVTALRSLWKAASAADAAPETLDAIASAATAAKEA